MSDFDHDEKQAILCLLKEVAQSDHQLDVTELEYMIHMADLLNYDLSESYLDLSREKAIEILRSMGKEKKKDFKKIILDMAKADSKLPYEETKMLINIVKYGELD